jgi:UDP-N-acetylmuramate dehydrogenase
MTTATMLPIELNVPIATWFKVGGGADRFARPTDADQLRQALELDPNLKVLGDGANLLVDDDGIDSLVVTLTGLNQVEWDASTGLLTVGAGVNLPKLITQTLRDGLAGLEVLGGIPASLGGALVMNAGGAFGQIADLVERVFALDRSGNALTLERSQIDFGYRHSGLNHLLITGAHLRLTPATGPGPREKLKEVMAYKKNSQPMADNSAGCCFKNPTLTHAIEGLGTAGQRVSAGKCIDLAGCKGLRIGTASVSPVHGNFLTADTGGKARDVIELIQEVERRVEARFGIKLCREVVVWQRASTAKS